jgi:virulence factor Mce-like protein
MAVKGYSQGFKLRLFGLGFIAFLVLCLFLLIAIFNQTFVRSEPLFLETTAAGSQLNNNADVKMRGMFVGRVAGQEVENGVVRLELAISPDHMEQIPDDVEAAIVPKTLFGEKFVELLIPEGSDSGEITPIASGETIPQSRTTAALEAERVFSNTVPLLRAVEPAELNMVLEQMATALQGRGDALGDNFSNAQRYFEGFEPSLPDFVENISLLATVADSYDRAAPDFLRFLRQQTVTTRTLVDQQDVLADFLAGTDEFNATMEQVLADNEERFVQLAAEGRPVIETFAADREGFGRFFLDVGGFWDGGIETIANPANNPKFGRSVDDTAPYLTISIEVSPGKGEQSAAGYFACARYGPHFGTQPGAQNPSCVEGAPLPPGGEPNPVEEMLGSFGVGGGEESAPTGEAPAPEPELPEFGALDGPDVAGGLQLDVFDEMLGRVLGVPAQEVPDIAGIYMGSLSGPNTPGSRERAERAPQGEVRLPTAPGRSLP